MVSHALEGKRAHMHVVNINIFFLSSFFTCKQVAVFRISSHSRAH